MPYRNKVFVSFDGDTDIHYYRLMRAWKQSDHTDFNFYDAHDLTQARDTSSDETIKRSLSSRISGSWTRRSAGRARCKRARSHRLSLSKGSQALIMVV